MSVACFGYDVWTLRTAPPCFTRFRFRRSVVGRCRSKLKSSATLLLLAPVNNYVCPVRLSRSKLSVCRSEVLFPSFNEPTQRSRCQAAKQQSSLYGTKRGTCGKRSIGRTPRNVASVRACNFARLPCFFLSKHVFRFTLLSFALQSHANES